MSDTQTGSSAGRDISPYDLAILENHYNNRCALTKEIGIQYAPVIPECDDELPINVSQMSWMIERGLVPQNISYGSRHNFIPLRADLHIHYNKARWAFLPTQRVLYFHIAFEQRHLLTRAATNPDPGRLSYHQSYKHFPVISEFDCYFSRVSPRSLTYDGGFHTCRVDNPINDFPTRHLIANVNLIVAHAPRFIATLHNPQARRSMALANYLHLLWDAEPATFRQIELPSSMPFTIDGAETYLAQSEPEAWASYNAMIEQDTHAQHARNKRSPTAEEPASPSGGLDQGRSDTERYEEGDFPDSTSQDGLLQSPLKRPNETNDKMGGSSLTSNDWAFLKYQSILGGPILNL